MKIWSLSSKEAENNFTDTLNHVACDLEHIKIKQPGQEPVYMIPAKDYELFIKLLEEAEDKIDIEEADKRINDNEQEKLTFEEFFNELEVESEPVQNRI
ncbi:type II toxin-antitoxin system Phd/YefM family antitoxin [Crocosphaera watsonii WH 8501]|uniref:Prevent-host-death protein n=6 Tax=Crocosphaera watsonii TaxID=263511 RepID=Q4C0Y7_CROWT|nr:MULTISPECIES: type II toxin-antitoxin system Phd/YefM family antitoxin [Crocosphaera]EAM49797.1 Prevent-host-death protein [Crocosphaera watsonii WH 8501]EHJ11661.1 Prevent-host-death protein [Crocosphaera watsonii WH 0003]MCH2246411.1 type II toxin-antitoxin system Phd/YefM family antitoxin [Crocosphaera sp.]NQZ62479.1 type II toxin-antitoxin system Phd/YefM family antitoxin [Crocosphaera sp.]CCQ52577.1 Prevent-host-death protein [Crocosphaera watsonii WH 8502]